MTDIEYQVLDSIKRVNDRGKTITYIGIINKLTQCGKSKETVMDTIQGFMKSDILICQGSNKLVPFEPLSLTYLGEKIYKKEHECRHPETMSRWKRTRKMFLNKVMSNIIDDAARGTSRFIERVCLIGISGILGFILGKLL